MKDFRNRNILSEPKQHDIDAKVKQETGRLALKLNRLEMAVNELAKTVNSALYQKEKRLNDVERENADLRNRVGKLEQAIDDILARPTPKTSDHIKDESEKIEIELVKLDYFKPRMGNC